VIIDPEKPTPCVTNHDLFYSPDDDGRTEIGRVDRESLAGLMCVTDCPLYVPCLERALVQRELYGVWGGMGEGERRKFTVHLREEGYDDGEIPTGRELVSSLRAFYVYNYTAEERLHEDRRELAS
jgi:WhiB family transcriptional regulator, redox-sensing transcriptional regulator